LKHPSESEILSSSPTHQQYHDADLGIASSSSSPTNAGGRINSSPNRKRMNPSLATMRPKSAGLVDRRSHSTRGSLGRSRKSTSHMSREHLDVLDHDVIDDGRVRPGTAAGTISSGGGPKGEDTSMLNNSMPEIKRSDKIVPSSFTTMNPKSRMACKVRVISEREAEQMQYAPQSEMMKQLFQNNHLKVYVGPTINSTRAGALEERVLTKAEYVEIDDLVDAELSNVKHSIMPTAFKRLKKQKINERIWDRFQRLDAIRKNMQRTDLLLQGYEVKTQQNEPVDLLNMEDVTDLVMRDLVSREGVMVQTKQLVEAISKENKKLAKEKHNLLQDLTNWFKSHDIDVESMHLNSTESDVRQLLGGVDDSPFGYSYKQSLSQMHYNKDKLQSIFADYKSIKDESRQEEKRKYLNEFARKMQDLESNMEGQTENLDDANSKIQLLLKKIIFLQEEVEDEKDLHQEKARQSQLYRRRFLKYKGLLMKIIERLKEDHIRELVDIQYIITGRYADEFDVDFPEEEIGEEDIENADLSTYFGRGVTETPTGELASPVTGANPNSIDDVLPAPSEDDVPSKLITASSIEATQSDIIGFPDRAIWFTQGPDVETPPEYILETTSASQYPLHQLTPLELKLKTQVDILNRRLMQLELEMFDQIDMDANEYAEKNSSMQGKNLQLVESLAASEQSLATLREQIAEKDSLIRDQRLTIEKLSSRDKTIMREMDKLKKTRLVRQQTTSKLAGDATPIKAAKDESEDIHDTDGSSTEDDEHEERASNLDDNQSRNATPTKEADPEMLKLKTQNEELERMIDSGEMSMDDLSVEQRKYWRNENYLLINQKRQLMAEIQSLQKAKKAIKAKSNQGPLAAFMNNVSQRNGDDHTNSAEPTKPKPSFKLIASRVAQEISEKQPKVPKKIPALRLLTEQLQEEKRLKDRNINILEQTTQDDLQILFDKNNAEEYSSTEDIMNAIDSFTDMGRLRNITKLLVLDREALLEQVFGTHKRIRKFYECMNHLFSTKSNQSVYTDSEFISEWIIFNRRLDVDIHMHNLPKQYKHTLLAKENKEVRRHAKRMTLREELKHQTTYVIEHENEEGRKKMNPMALTRSCVGLLVRMYLHFKLFKRRQLHATDKRRDFSPSRSYSASRSKSARRRRSGKSGKKDVVTQSLVRMESHRKQMKQRWEQKKKQILQEQRNRFAGYSLVPGLPGSATPADAPDGSFDGAVIPGKSQTPPSQHDDEDERVTGPTGVLQTANDFDAPPSLDKESIETKRRLNAISPRHSMVSKSPRPRTAHPGTLTKKKTRLSIDLSGSWNPPSIAEEPSNDVPPSLNSRVTRGWATKTDDQ